MNYQATFKLAPIAIAVLGLMAGTAQAQSTFKLGGKFDTGYQFKHTANIGTPGRTTSEAQGDGGASTTRITMDANEVINKGLEAFVSFDLRFTNVHEGKGGLNNNDKKVMGLRTPFGRFTWGTYNITNLVIADKPYMTNYKDMEIVKFGISKLTQSDLTNRNTEYVSPTLTIGPANMLVKGNFAFGDNRKAGLDSAPSGDAWSLGYEFVWGDVKAKEVTLSSVVVRRTPTTTSAATKDGYMSWDTSVTYQPKFLKGLKLSSSYFHSRGYANGQNNGFKYKNTNFVVSYNYDKLWQAGVGISHANDLGATNRNSGRAIMLGGAFWLSPTTYLYSAVAEQDWARNEQIAGGKFDGTKAGFKDTLKKQDQTYYRVGIVKEF